MPLSSCPVCGGRSFLDAVPAARIQSEVEQRNEFVHQRLSGGAADAGELKDLTDFMHGAPAPLAVCPRCNLMVRDERRVRAADSYEEDPNDPAWMAQVYPRYVQAFRNKRAAYAERLPAHASVLELGSHLGAFLQVAEEWNWRPVGLDIGKDTSEFAARLGLDVRRETMEDTRLPAGRADAIFIWNCFEQLAEPGPALAAAYRLLARHGLLVVRVPNPEFYLEHRDTRPDWLAWNNLLGFPYLYGYTPGALNALLIRHGFEPVRAYDTELVTMPFAEPSPEVAEEQRAVSGEVAAYAQATDEIAGPWIEIVYRKREKVERRRPRVDSQFLPRAA